MPFHSRKRHHSSLKREIEEVVAKELRDEIPLKYYGLEYAGSFGSITGPKPYVLIDLSTILPEDDLADPSPWKREGNIVMAKTLRLRGYVGTYSGVTGLSSLTTSPVCTYRLLIFSWAPAEDNSTMATVGPANVIDLQQITNGGHYINAPHRSGPVAQQVKIHYDEVHTIYPVPPVFSGTTGTMFFFPGQHNFNLHVKLDHPIDFSYGTGPANGNAGAGKVWALFLNNQPTTVTAELPNICFYSQLYFTDA